MPQPCSLAEKHGGQWREWWKCWQELPLQLPWDEMTEAEGAGLDWLV